ncbi:MAG TPA: MauE/DoxX family redox-associated membrane protein [Solirubrobacteraceae bacterium]|jgi:hypothetical protein|nr:MauE/DoxX family redox-associated membrane protein [Solirubrobacteraceae bacterium]
MTPSALAGTWCITALAVVLAVAGASKLRQPEPASRALEGLGAPAGMGLARALGAAELALAALALLAPVRVGGMIVAGLFAGFALVAQRLGATAAEDCGCFGERDGGPPPRVHVALNALGALCAAIAAAGAPPSPAQLAREDPGTMLVLLAGACVLAALWRRVFRGRAAAGEAVAHERAAWGHPAGSGDLAAWAQPTLTPASGGPLSERLVGASATFLEQRVSRRSALVRIALVGSALSVAPLRYLLRPETALAVILPSQCASGECADGYTAFCCEINRGLNRCPPDTFAGGWWMCTDYSGRQLCAGQGVRYYVDCNAIPGSPYPGGCRCANGTCAERRVNCNVFRYGQCNTHLAGVTPVVCRMVTCQNPGSIPALNCSSSVSVDDAVCAHEAPCLEPPAKQLVGAGGV